ncbi:hypothetical protein M0802_006668 [Mischocyttarus mexicanus]|nr:hypothetical protein M0802_006668 [Mischocyttarus mexicanus]
MFQVDLQEEEEEGKGKGEVKRKVESQATVGKEKHRGRVKGVEEGCKKRNTFLLPSCIQMYMVRERIRRFSKHHLGEFFLTGDFFRSELRPIVVEEVSKLVEIGQERKNGAQGENVAQLTANWSGRGRAYIFEREAEEEEEKKVEKEEENKRKELKR